MGLNNVFGLSDAAFEIASIVVCVLAVALLLTVGAIVLIRTLSRVRPHRSAMPRKLHWVLMAAGFLAGPAAGVAYWAAWSWLGGFASEETRINELWGFLEAGVLVGVSACVAMVLSNFALADSRRVADKSQPVIKERCYCEQPVVAVEEPEHAECLVGAGAN